MDESKFGLFSFRGGHPSLDFINTASARNREEIVERVGSYGDLLRWACEAGVIDGDRAAELAALAAAKPRAAAAALRRARELREAAFRLFSCLIDDERPRAADLELLNRRAPRTHSSGKVYWDNGRFGVVTPPPASPLDEPLEVVTRGIVDLLTGENSVYLSRCHDPDCSWLFLDRSPAHARRWCSMADCGNRAKARRHYRKHKAEARQS